MIKEDPTQFLTEDERYLQHFWKPCIGDSIVNSEGNFKIKKIIEAQAILEELPKKVIWLQDFAWKPSLENCDDIITRFNARIAGDLILYTKENRPCFFLRPFTLAEYVNIIRQLRVFNHFQEVH